MVKYISKDGDILSWIVWKHYGATGNNLLEKVLDFNYRLEDRGDTLPPGVDIFLPNISATPTDNVRLWD